MKISISKTHTEEVTIQVPSFWKAPTTAYNEYVAVIDENNVLNVVLMDDVSYIKNGTAEKMQTCLTDAHQNFNICTEEDFMSAHDEALQGMSLKPVIKSYEQQLRDLMKVPAMIEEGKELIKNNA